MYSTFMSVFLFGIIFRSLSALSIPKYIKLCRGSDPDFDKCSLQSGKEAIKHLLSGEKSLRLLPLSPLKLPFVQLENRDDFQLNLTDVEVLGLDKAELVDFHADLVKRKIKIVVHLAEIFLKGQFHADGRLLILPIKGDGPGTIKAYGGHYTYTFNYNLVKKNGQEYAKITTDDFSFTLQKAEIDVTRLFGSDKRLGTEITKFLNENWLEVVKDFQGVIGLTIGRICRTIAGSVFEKVPFREIILP